MDYSELGHLAQSSSKLAVAVSGGSDSLGLLYYLSDWAKAVSIDLAVLTFDHNLRPESAAEAKGVAAHADKLGWSHRTLTWSDPKRQQSLARRARLNALADASLAAGSTILMLGHTKDDVTETLLMRRQRRAPVLSWAGPTALSPHPFWPNGRGIKLVRPFVGTGRHEIQQHLLRQGVEWVDDPSNQNSDFERVRVRQFLQRHPRYARFLSELTGRAQVWRAYADRQIGAIISDGDRVNVDASGLISFESAGLSQLLVKWVLAVLARFASGGETQVPLQRWVNLPAKGGRLTLGGAWLQRQGGSRFLIGRDPGLADLSNRNGIWDGRYIEDQTAACPEDWPFLIRDSAPPGVNWREIISDRLGLETACLCAAPLPVRLVTFEP